MVERYGWRDCHVVTSAIEHPAVLDTCRYLKRRGIDVALLRVGADGIVDPSELRNALRPNTRLVSIMAANNVVGTLQPIAELGRIASDHGVLFHTDAVQAAGKVPLDVRKQPIDLLSLSAHKLHGPKGIGALYVRRGVTLEPLIHGGGQERGLRSATENVAGIVGFGVAAEIARTEMGGEVERLTRLARPDHHRRHRADKQRLSARPLAKAVDGAHLPRLCRAGRRSDQAVVDTG